MSNITVRPEQFSKALQKALQEYEEHTMDVIQSSATDAARHTVSDLKGSAPSGGKYGRGWSHKKQGNGRTSFSDTAYNRMGQLTHLLEKPHATGGGGNYPKNVDYTGTIARIEEKNTNRFMEEVLRKI